MIKCDTVHLLKEWNVMFSCDANKRREGKKTVKVSSVTDREVVLLDQI